MRNKLIKVDRTPQVAVIWLNRPENQNALDRVTVIELDAALASLDSDASVRAVVLAGLGPAFGAGIDIRWIKQLAGSPSATHKQDSLLMAKLLERLDSMGKPTVARVHGVVGTVGLGLIAACDIAVASLESDFSASDVRLGLAAAICAPYLIRAIGERHARRYLLSGEVFTAAEAYRIGLVHELARDDELDTKVNELLGQLTLGGPIALATTKEVVAKVANCTDFYKLAPGFASNLAKMCRSKEGSEGIEAFLENRLPAWSQPETPKRRKRPLLSSVAAPRPRVAKL